MGVSVYPRLILATLFAICWLSTVPPVAEAADGRSSVVSDQPQPLPGIPADLTPEEVREHVARMPDADVRATLIRSLDEASSSRQGASTARPLLQMLGGRSGELRNRLRETIRQVPELAGLPVQVVERLTAGRDVSWLGTVVLVTVAILGVGFLGEWLVTRFFLRKIGGISGELPESIAGRCALCVLATVLDVLRVLAFGVAAMGVYLALYQGHEPTRALVTAVVAGVVLFRLVDLVAQTVLAPASTDMRLFPLGDAVAARIVTGTKVISGILIAGALGISVLGQIGIEPPLVLLIVLLFSVIMVALGIFVFWRLREPVAAAILSGGAAGRTREVLAAHWHVLASSYLIVTWIMATTQRLTTGEMVLAPPLASLAMLVALPAVDWLMRDVVARFFTKLPGRADDEEGPEAGDGRPENDPYFQVIVSKSRVLLAVLAVFVLARIWGVDLQGVIASGLGQTVASSFFTVIVTLVLGSAIWGIIKTAIDRQLPEPGPAEADMDGGDGMGTGGTRAETLLPLFRNFFLITLVVVVGLVLLSAIGVDIGPLLAGAGMVGIAVGFGAQTLVRDIFSGVFFLIDDAFRVGEYVVIGDIRGMVEKISIRSLRLRHHNGPVHTIPFGEIKHMTNYSRDWVIMKLEIRVPFETDIEKVRKIVKKIGVALMDDPIHGPNFLQPLKSQGVNRMDDSAFILRVKFMAKPGEQFVLRREVFRRIQEAFKEQGIQFAPRRVIVDASPGVSPAAAAAAEEAIEKTETTSSPSQDTP